MANYRSAKKQQFTQAEESRLRKLFNEWAASVEAYDRKHLGDDIRIIEVWDSPLYRVLLKTQYDTRAIQQASELLKGRTFPTPALKTADIKRWSLAPLPTDFSYRKSLTRLNNTTFAGPCSPCSGSGKLTCAECSGRGKVMRSVQTSHECPTCKGYGYTYKREVIQESRQYHDYSDGGKLKLGYFPKEVSRQVTCSTCNGQRKIVTTTQVEKTCPSCSGSGRLICTTCKGEGRLAYYLQFEHNQYTKVVFQRLMPPHISSADADKMSKMLGDSAPWKVVERLRIEGENFDRTALASRPVVGSLLARVPGWVEHPANTAVCFHRLEVCECEAKTVIYEVDGHRYTCLLVGEEWRLVTVDSPVTTRMNDLKEQVNALCRRRRYGEAWSLLHTVNKYPQAGSAAAVMKGQLEERMAMMTRYGANMAILFCGVIFVPMLYLIYSHFDFLAPWTRWFIAKTDLSMELLMLGSVLYILLASMKYQKFDLPPSSYRIASSQLRFMRGFVLGIGWFFHFFLATIVMTYFGLLPLIVQLCLWGLAILFFVVALIIMIIQGIWSIFF